MAVNQMSWDRERSFYCQSHIVFTSIVVVKAANFASKIELTLNQRST